MVARGYKDTEIGVIPVEWEVINLDDITTKITSGGTPSRSKDEYFTNGTINWLKTGELRDCYIYGAKEKITEEAINNSSAKLFPIDTLLIAMYGATIGQTAYLKTECATNQACCAIMFDRKVANPFFYWKYFYFIKDTLIGLGRGAGQPNISQGIIKDIKIPLPPLKEQEKIADILCSADDKIDVIASQIQKAETLKKGLLQKLLSEGIGHNEFKDSDLGKIPESWEIEKVKDLISKNILKSVQDGNHGEIHPKSSDYVEQGIPFVMANNITRNNLDINTCYKISEYQYNNLRIGYSFGGDVLLSHKATIGLTAIVPLNTNIMLTPQVTAYSISDDNILLNIYLYYYFQSRSFQNKLRIYSKQSTRSYIGITAQKELFIILPSLKEQKQIADILSTADEKLEILRAKKEKYETLKKGLLQKLLSGEVRV